MGFWYMAGLLLKPQTKQGRTTQLRVHVREQIPDSGSADEALTLVGHSQESSGSSAFGPPSGMHTIGKHRPRAASLQSVGMTSLWDTELTLLLLKDKTEQDN